MYDYSIKWCGRRYESIKDFCKFKNISLIEDSAQALGAFNNTSMQELGELVVVFHFILQKLRLLGDGGAITNNDELNEFARSVRDHGRKG